MAVRFIYLPIPIILSSLMEASIHYYVLSISTYRHQADSILVAIKGLIIYLFSKIKLFIWKFPINTFRLP